MKQSLLSGLMSFLLILSATFSPVGFAGPGPDIGGDKSPSFSDSDQNTDINWSDEAELLSFLQNASQEDLQTMSDETYEQIISSTKDTAVLTSIVGTMLGGVGIVMLIRSLSTKPIVKVNTAGPIPILVTSATFITLTLTDESGTITRNMSVEDLKQMVGEDLSNKVVAMQQALAQLNQKIEPLRIALQLPYGYQGDLRRILVLFPETESIPMTESIGPAFHVPHVDLSPEAAVAFKNALKKKIMDQALALDFANLTANDYKSFSDINILNHLRNQNVSFENVIFREDPRARGSSDNLYDPPATAYTRQTYTINIGELLDFPSDRTVLLIGISGRKGNGDVAGPL